MPGKWLESLKEEEDIHNTAAALRIGHNLQPNGPGEKPKTPIKLPSKTSKTPSEKIQAPISRSDKTSKTSQATQLGLIATWAHEFGYVSLHDPGSGEWWDLPTKEAPDWALNEARRRKELYRDGNHKAYRLTSREMEKLWREEHDDDVDVGIVEEYPVEGEE